MEKKEVKKTIKKNVERQNTTSQKTNKKVLNLYEEIRKMNNKDEYEEIIGALKTDIEKLDPLNLDTKKTDDINKTLQLEIANATEKIAIAKNVDEEEKANTFLTNLIQLKKDLSFKTIYCNPFEKFIYAEERQKEKMLKEFFININKEIHWLDIDTIDFTSNHKDAINEKNEIVVEKLLETLESELDIVFSNFQKMSLKKDFLKVTNKLHGEYDDVISECEKIKKISETKISAKPTLNKYVSKSMLNSCDASNKISTVRMNFLQYISLTEKQRNKQIADNLILHMKSIKEILENEKEEINGRMKMLCMFIILGIIVATTAPAVGSLGIITVGSVIGVMQSRNIILENKMRKIDEEIINIQNGNSKIVDDAVEKIERKANELFEDAEYREVAELYKKKKKNILNQKEIQEKVANCIRNVIINNIMDMSEEEKNKLVEKVHSDLFVTVNEEKHNIADNDKEEIYKQKDEAKLNFDIEIEI